LRGEGAKARDRELDEHATLGAHQLVPFVNYHGAKIAEDLADIGTREQQR
jgi:hypothetical protein